MACEDYYGEECPPIIQLEMEMFYTILDKAIVNEYDEWGTHETSTMCGVMPYDLEKEHPNNDNKNTG